MIQERYHDKTYLGSGGMASVYKAFDQMLERHVAIKEMAEALRGFEDVRHLFLNEARKMASIRHPNVVQVYDVSDEGDVPTIIMEYMSGGSVASRMDSGALTSDEVLRIVRQVTLGLQAIHGAGLVHRDVKPENILEDNGAFKITDFGVAMSGDEEALPFVTSKYAAPEVLIEPDKIGPSSDIYSLGIMATELLLGHAKFETAVHETIEKDNKLQLPAIKDSVQAFWQQWVASTSELPPLHKLDTAISPEVSDFLASMTRRDRSARIADCDSVLEDLDSLMKLGSRRAQAATEYSPKMKRKLDKQKAEGEAGTGSARKKKPLWFKATIGVGAFLLAAIAALFLLPTTPRFYLEVATTPPGASVTVNGQLLENDPTPTWFNGAWGDSVQFQLDSQEPLDVVLEENMQGLSPIENGYRLELGWSQPEWIGTSTEAAAFLAERLAEEWPLEVSLETPGSRLMEDGSYSVVLGTDLSFQVTSERPASLAMIHLGSNDVLTLIYPNPLGLAPQLEGNTTSSAGEEIGLAAQEPLGREWFIFIAGENLQLPPSISGVQKAGGWAGLYPFGEQGAPGEALVLWLADTYGAGKASANILQIEVVAEEKAP